jgi:hypothetical protein
MRWFHASRGAPDQNSPTGSADYRLATRGVRRPDHPSSRIVGLKRAGQGRDDQSVARCCSPRYEVNGPGQQLVLFILRGISRGIAPACAQRPASSTTLAMPCAGPEPGNALADVAPDGALPGQPGAGRGRDMALAVACSRSTLTANLTFCLNPRPRQPLRERVEDPPERLPCKGLHGRSRRR